jgi:hypothetical protein
MEVVPFGEQLPDFRGCGAELDALPLEERIRHIYDEEHLNTLLHKFAFGEPVSDEDPRMVDEDIVGDALVRYAFKVTYEATQKATASLNTAAVKGAFEHVYSSMDEAAEAKLVRPNPIRSLLNKAGIARRPAPQHFVRLDDKFWSVQFPREMAAQTWVKRQPGDSDAGFMARGVYHTLATHVFSHFSHIQQADRFA